MDWAKRWVAGQVLMIGTGLVLKGLSEVNRVSAIHNGGLTPKEILYLRKRMIALAEANNDLIKLGQRVRKSTGPMARHGA